MIPEIYTRHTPDCPHRANRYSRKCRCPKWLSFGRKRISAKTRSWEQAERVAKSMTGEIAAPARTVRESVASFLADKAQQSLSPNWERKLKRELENFAAWCEANLVRLPDVNLHALERYRATWTGSPITRRKRQERLRSFFLYCLRHKWVDENPASHLSTIKVQDRPTMPLDREQFEAALRAAEKYNPKAPDAEYRRKRATAMLLLMRWSGLRIGDAARLERSRLSERGVLYLYTQKTGTPVYVPLPPDVVTRLRELPNGNPRYFFWNGESAIDSPGKRWWQTLKTIFKAAGVPEAHPHCLRDTFAVELLLAGVPIEQVSILLGHSSVKITEKHYLPFVKARQAQLEESVRKSWHISP